jgi:hypothetical protein
LSSALPGKCWIVPPSRQDSPFQVLPIFFIHSHPTIRDFSSEMLTASLSICIVTCRVVHVTKITGLLRMIGFISTSVTVYLNCSYTLFSPPLHTH